MPTTLLAATRQALRPAAPGVPVAGISALRVAAPPVRAVRGPYRVRLAASVEQVRAAQRLRFDVYNVELGAGYRSSYATARDADAFDDVADHLLVIDEPSGLVVATCRLQTGWRALAALGWSAERLFDLSPFELRRARLVEASRGCIAPEHRSRAVLELLWRGIAAYAVQNGARELLATLSIGSRDPRLGAAAWERVQSHLVADELVTLPHAAHACALGGALSRVQPPQLLAALLSRGARVAGPPAIDREFGTIELLAWLDLEAAGVSGWTRPN